MTRAVLLLPLVLLLPACGGDPSGPGVADECQPAYAGVVATVDSAAAAAGYSRATLVLARGGQVVCTHSVGSLDPDEAVYLASASKWLTAAGVMAAVDAGLLQLDAPISTYSADFAGRQGTATTRQLLSMTAGWGGNHPCIFNTSTPMATCLRAIGATSLDHEPGTTFYYGGTSLQVAGGLAAARAGTSWNALFRARITEPLGMTKTQFADVDNPLLSGGGMASARDYARFLVMLLRGGTGPSGRVLSQGAVNEMLKVQTTGARMAGTPDPEAAGYGLGGWIDAADAAGTIQASSPGASGFVPWIDLRRDVAGVVVFPARSDLDDDWASAAAAVQRKVRQVVGG